MPPEPLAVFGEVCTAPLPTAVALRRGEIEQLLELVPGQRAQWRSRPVSLGISAQTGEGIDCPLAAPAHPVVRAIGTVGVRAVIVGGRVVQSSSQATIVRSDSDRRKSWHHYLRELGVVEVITKVRTDTSVLVAEGFLQPSNTDVLDLTPVNERLLARIAVGDPSGHDGPPRIGATRLRWAARVDAVSIPRIAFRVHDEIRRTALVLVPSECELTAAQRFFEDLAVHDWLLTAMTGAIERADLAGPGSEDAADILAPVLHHLGHLWAPGAHTPAPLRPLWTQLQDDPGMSVEWSTSVDHLRNQLVVATWNALKRSRVGGDM
ncbi:SCO2521 family protein [Nocardia sp. NPDC005366]|uniref:SCO2521 family protein n=1 Tax=Nocardia sp. NPDC005366 TaxID=3156878 RepID=UPI0033A137DD